MIMRFSRLLSDANFHLIDLNVNQMALKNFPCSPLTHQREAQRRIAMLIEE